MAQELFRTLDKSIRRQRIIDIAVELFRKQGYRTTTLDDVANELGITKAALYHYVESKDDLLYTIYKKAFNAIFEETNRIAAMDLPPDEKLRKIIQNHIKNIIIKNQSLISVFFAEENQLPDKYSRMVRSKKREYDEILQGIIREGISLGLFEEEDPRLLGYAIVGMCNWIYLWFSPKVPYSPDEIADQFIRVLERGFLQTKRKRIKKEIPVRRLNHRAGKKGLSDRTIERMKTLNLEMIELLEGLENLYAKKS